MPLTSLKQIAGGEELLNRLIAVEKQLALLKVNNVIIDSGSIERNHDYAQGDTVFNTVNDIIDFGTLLKYSTPGTTGAQELVIPDNAKNGDLITDGTVTWTLSVFSSAR